MVHAEWWVDGFFDLVSFFICCLIIYFLVRFFFFGQFIVHQLFLLCHQWEAHLRFFCCLASSLIHTHIRTWLMPLETILNNASVKKAFFKPDDSMMNQLHLMSIQGAFGGHIKNRSFREAKNSCLNLTWTPSSPTCALLRRFLHHVHVLLLCTHDRTDHDGSNEALNSVAGVTLPPYRRMGNHSNWCLPPRVGLGAAKACWKFALAGAKQFPMSPPRYEGPGKANLRQASSNRPPRSEG